MKWWPYDFVVVLSCMKVFALIFKEVPDETYPDVFFSIISALFFFSPLLQRRGETFDIKIKQFLDVFTKTTLIRD